LRGGVDVDAGEVGNVVDEEGRVVRRRILLRGGGFGDGGDMTARGRKLEKVADV
jgi:hypothetical protein